MKKDNFLYIEDIKNAIDWVLDDYVLNMTFEDFSKDPKTQDTVIRQIAVIGEAMNKMDAQFLTKYPKLPSKEAVSMRNILVHDYDNIDLEELWKTIKVDLPSLKETVVKILSEEIHK